MSFSETVKIRRPVLNTVEYVVLPFPVEQRMNMIPLIHHASLSAKTMRVQNRLSSDLHFANQITLMAFCTLLRVLNSYYPTFTPRVKE
jgi:hypothetical protein